MASLLRVVAQVYLIISPTNKVIENNNFGWKKYEFDPVYPIIKALSWANVIKLRKVPSESELSPVEVEEEVNS